MVDVDLAIKLGIAAGTFLCTAIPTTCGWIHSLKAKKAAKTLAEKEAAKNDMTEHLNGLIDSAEQLYSAVDAALKAQGSTAGPMKKDSVMTKLQAYAIEHNYSFDSEYWSNKIDNVVELTRKVNKRATD